MRKEKTKQDNNKKFFFKALLMGLFWGLVVFAVAMSCFALVMLKADVPKAALFAMSTFAVGISAFVSGFASSRVVRKKGAIVGAVGSVPIFLVVFICSLVANGCSISNGLLIKLLIMLICGALGGILAVNMRSKK